MDLSAAVRAKLFTMRDQARTHLAENEMPFWVNNAWDEEYGGFLTRLDVRGRRLDDNEKFLMMQVRMLASLSWAHAFGTGAGAYLDLAGRTFDFLVKSLWDRDEGGFFFSVTRDGRPFCRRKNTDANAYALTGLSVYGAVSGRDDAVAYGTKLFDVLESHARDGNLGYVEDFDGAEWVPLNAEQMNLAADAAAKTIDMHTNVLEATSYFVEATGGRRGVDALGGILELILERGIDRTHGCTITAVTRAWEPLPDAAGTMTTSFGLNVELAWLLLRAGALLGTRDGKPVAVARSLVDHALRYGFDAKRGGLAAHGPYSEQAGDAVTGGAARLIRPWWTQAELINALVDLAAVTREPRYVEALLTHWQWVWTHQIDHVNGSWFQDVDPRSGKPLSTDKGGEWKTSFHTSRAMIRLVDGIDRLTET